MSCDSCEQAPNDSLPTIYALYRDHYSRPVHGFTSHRIDLSSRFSVKEMKLHSDPLTNQFCPTFESCSGSTDEATSKTQARIGEFLDPSIPKGQQMLFWEGMHSLPSASPNKTVQTGNSLVWVYGCFWNWTSLFRLLPSQDAMCIKMGQPTFQFRNISRGDTSNPGKEGATVQSCHSCACRSECWDHCHHLLINTLLT